MDDEQILTLYWQRDSRAIEASQEKYGPYCLAVSRSILADHRDCEECVSDTWLHAWQAIPDIARRYGLTANHTTVLLSRTRKKLRQHLEQEGYLP